MSVSNTYFRHLCILRKLQKAPATKQEIMDYYELECETHGYEFIFSSRTFLRDKEEILALHKKDIHYRASDKKYFLEEDEVPDDFGNRITDAYNTYLALNMADGISEFVHLEKRRPQGMEHFHSLLHALKNRLIITFSYEKYLDNNISERRAEPLALKEFKGRWYLLSKDIKDNVIKTFALDRMSALEITRQKYKPENGFNVNSYYQHCFGIIRPADPETRPVTIKLSFQPDRGKYIKSLPLHESQKTIRDTDDELQIELQVYITHDLIMELLSYGHDIKVIEPLTLKKTLNGILAKADALYKE